MARIAFDSIQMLEVVKNEVRAGYHNHVFKKRVSVTLVA